MLRLRNPAGAGPPCRDRRAPAARSRDDAQPPGDRADRPEARVARRVPGRGDGRRVILLFAEPLALPPAQRPTVISASIGQCESAYSGSMSMLRLLERLLLAAAASGITVVSAAGDTGSSDCTSDDTGGALGVLQVDYPARLGNRRPQPARSRPRLPRRPRPRLHDPRQPACPPRRGLHFGRRHEPPPPPCSQPASRLRMRRERASRRSARSTRSSTRSPDRRARAPFSMTSGTAPTTSAPGSPRRRAAAGLLAAAERVAASIELPAWAPWTSPPSRPAARAPTRRAEALGPP